MRTLTCFMVIVILITFSACIGEISYPRYRAGDHITGQLRQDLEAGRSIKLGEGTYYLCESLAVFGYPGGTISGQGMGKTFIEPCDTSKFRAEYGHTIETETAIFLALEGCTGNVIIRDITFQVPQKEPAVPHYNAFNNGITTAIDNIIVVSGGNITATFKNLHIKGERIENVEMQEPRYNIGFPLIATSLKKFPELITYEGKIDMVMSNCIIDGASEDVEFFASNGGTTIVEHNVFRNFSIGGFWLGWGVPPAIGIIRNNTFENTAGSIKRHSDIKEYSFIHNMENGKLLPDTSTILPKRSMRPKNGITKGF